MTARGKRFVAAGVALAALAVAIATPYVTTAAFLLDLSGADGRLRSLIPVRARTVTHDDVDVPTRHGAIAARIYVPSGRPSPTVVVFPGVHGGGVDAPRLTQLCGRLSASGLTVVCTPLPDLRAFRITSRSTDMMEDVAVWASTQPALARGGRVTLVGVSFAGGLALVAAGRPALRDRLHAVISIGGHGDLTRTLRYLATGVLPDGTTRPPHDYALAVVALTMADRLVPPDQVADFEHAVMTFLTASLDGGPGHDEAQRLMGELEASIAALPEPGRSLARAVAERDVARVGEAIAPFIEQFGDDPGMSPALAPAPNVPVFLLHGTTDNVIPSTEAPLTAADLSNRGHIPVRWLLTPLLTHAHLATAANLRDTWQLVDFWRAARRRAQ